MVNPQTESRAIARKWHSESADINTLAAYIATALAAKDAELERLRQNEKDYETAYSAGVEWMTRAKRAEAQLAAKDANIKMLGEQMVTERLHGYELLERAERAEAQLAEANKALEQIAKPYDGDECQWPVPLEKIGRELRTRQQNARAALAKGGSRNG